MDVHLLIWKANGLASSLSLKRHSAPDIYIDTGTEFASSGPMISMPLASPAKTQICRGGGRRPLPK